MKWTFKICGLAQTKPRQTPKNSKNGATTCLNQVNLNNLCSAISKQTGKSSRS